MNSTAHFKHFGSRNYLCGRAVDPQDRPVVEPRLTCAVCADLRDKPAWAVRAPRHDGPPRDTYVEAWVRDEDGKVTVSRGYVERVAHYDDGPRLLLVRYARHPFLLDPSNVVHLMEVPQAAKMRAVRAVEEVSFVRWHTIHQGKVVDGGRSRVKVAYVTGARRFREAWMRLDEVEPILQTPVGGVSGLEGVLQHAKTPGEVEKRQDALLAHGFLEPNTGI